LDSQWALAHKSGNSLDRLWALAHGSKNSLAGFWALAHGDITAIFRLPKIRDKPLLKRFNPFLDGVSVPPFLN